MLQPHSFLWHYLWVGPHVLEAVLALVLWRRGFHKKFPFFFTYLVYEAAEEISLWVMDWLPGVSAQVWWRTACAGMAIEGLLKFAFVLELFSHLLRPRPRVAKLGRWMIASTGAILVVIAALAAVHAPISSQFPIADYTHILGQAIYLIQCGLLLFIFLFEAYFHLAWNRWDFGIALGASISACVHLATWAVFANVRLLEKGYFLDFLNMATYHICVLIWFYYLLKPELPRTNSVCSPALSEPEEVTTIPPTVRKLRPAWLFGDPAEQV